MDKANLRTRKNTITIVAEPLIFKYKRGTVNKDSGTFQIITAAPKWNQTLFSGLALVIVQSTGEAGDITLTATSNGLNNAEIKINTTKQ